MVRACGSWGCLETVAGVPGWARRAEALLAAGRPSTLAGRSPLDPQVIVEAARGEDAVALEVVDGENNSIVWNGDFDTDGDAHTEFLRTVESEGMDGILRDPARPN